MTSCFGHRQRLIVLLLTLGLFVLAPIVQAHAESSTSVAQPGRFAGAIPIAKVAGPLSEGMPDQCAGTTSARREPLTSTRPGGGYSISPGDVEFRNLQPDTDYSSCLVISNYNTAGGTIPITISDVDIRAAEDASSGISVIEDPTGVGTWVVPSTRKALVGPNERVTVPYILHTPASLPAGTVVGGIKVNFNPKTSLREAITQRVYVTNPGGRRAPLTLSQISSDRLLHSDKGEAFHVHFTARNASDYLETFNASVTLHGLGRAVSKTRITGSALLPDGQVRLNGDLKDLPWIGVYRPTLTVAGRSGTVTKTLPWVVILPPTPYFIALVLAILCPIVYFILKWRSRRREWMQYLEDYDEDEDGADDEWDPTQPSDDYTQT